MYSRGAPARDRHLPVQFELDHLCHCRGYQPPGDAPDARRWHQERRPEPLRVHLGVPAPAVRAPVAMQHEVAESCAASMPPVLGGLHRVQKDEGRSVAPERVRVHLLSPLRQGEYADPLGFEEMNRLSIGRTPMPQSARRRAPRLGLEVPQVGKVGRRQLEPLRDPAVQSTASDPAASAASR